MRIGIDGIVLRGRDAGTLRYFQQLVLGLVEFDEDAEYVIFANPALQSLEPVRKNFMFQPVPPIPFLPPIVRQQFYRGWHARGKLDLLHSPVSPLPISFQGGKAVTTVFDLVFELFPETTKWTGRLWWKVFGRRGLRRADRIVAISESTKSDLGRVSGIQAETIRVIYPSTGDIFKPVANPQPALAKYNLHTPFILSVGTLQRRKNIGTLIRAFARAKRVAGLDHVLVLAGERGWHYREIFKAAQESGVSDQIVFLNHVPDEDLPTLYSAADLLVNLSRYEGFGFPVLEAMACGTPVLASNVSSLPEIVGDAGVLVSPDDVEQVASEIARVVSNHELHTEMKQRGLKRATFFTRHRFAREIFAMYDQVCSQ